MIDKPCTIRGWCRRHLPPVPRVAHPPRLVKTYRSGYWGVAFGVETIHSNGFEGTQWFVQAGRKVWVFRPLARGES